jgi:hypothetical protein
MTLFWPLLGLFLTAAILVFERARGLRRSAFKGFIEGVGISYALKIPHSSFRDRAIYYRFGHGALNAAKDEAALSELFPGLLERALLRASFMQSR